MSENGASSLDEQQIRAVLAEELDGIAPRRDLWPSVQAAVQCAQREA